MVAGSIGRVSFMVGVPGSQPYNVVWSSGDSNVTFVDSLGFGPISATITDCNGCVTSASAFVGVSVFPGCTDPTAFNYNPQANVDDSSCVPFIYGCIDSLNLVSGLFNLNYDPLATTDSWFLY